MKTFKYLLLYLLVIELALPWMAPLSPLYDYRLNYAVVKNNTGDIDVVLDQIKRQINSQNLKDYIIILGDSVAFSGPGPAEESIGAHLQEYYRRHGQERAVFNLSMPAMQAGDIYTMLLKLDQHGISSDRIIINIIYAGFAERNPDPAVVFWLQKDLARLDPVSFKQVKPQLQANGAITRIGPAERLNYFITRRLAIFSYRDLIKIVLQQKLGRRSAQEEANILGDPLPWYEKEGLSKALDIPAYKKAFAVKPFDMSSRNPQIYFLNKIMEHQRSRETVIFMAAVNQALMPQVGSSGYQANLQRVKDYFAGKQVQYIDFHGTIDQRLFSDHVHLIGPGYALVADRLGRQFMAGEKRL